MGKKVISNTFTVNIVVDGISQQQIFTRNANATLPPRSQSDTPTLPSGWTYTPQGVDNIHPDEYVSMRSKDSSGVWSEYSSKVPYSHYGEDGTSISIKGAAIDIVQGTYPDVLEPYEQDLSLTSLGDIILVDETKDSTLGATYIKRVQPFIEDEELKHFVVEGVTVGDGYLIASKNGQDADEGHLFVATEFDDSGGDYSFWQDCGRIKGEKGDDAVMYVLEPSIPQFNTDQERTKAQVCTVRAYKIEGKTKSAFTGCFEIAPDSMLGRISYSWGNYVSLGTNDDRNATAYTVSLWDKDPRYLAVDEPDPVLLASITIPIAFDGAQGERGKIGRFFYFGGEFNAADTTQTFIVNDAQAPYFEHTENGQKRYHVFNYGTNGSYTMAQMWAISSNWNNKPWESMTNDFKYIITEAIFAQFAQFGSAIINGDWMLSTNGTINGVAYNNGALYNNSPAYTWFDPLYPNESVNTTHNVNGKTWTGYNFVPNYAVDLLTGATYQQNAYVNGSVRTKSMGLDFVDIRNVYNIDGELQTEFIVGDDTVIYDSQGNSKNIQGYWNFIVGGQTEHILLPTKSYANFGQRVILYNPYFSLVDGLVSGVGAIYIDQAQELRYYQSIRGVGTETVGTLEHPVPEGQYDPVSRIDWVNGVVELMCVPAVDPLSGQLCDWAVLNIGTNIYKLQKYTS